MKSLPDVLRALVGAQAVAADAPLLTAAEARTAKLIREHGVLYTEAVEDEIALLVSSGPATHEQRRVAYYLGLQMGWRAAQRLL